ncbi:MAG: glycosyltransferase family 4 protein [Acidobacteriota bacterium]|nr:glycosyltransferase family 4 protein [Acidobacteriota bacterium]
MRVLVDGRPLQGATGRRGVGAYVRCLLHGLMRADAGIEAAVLVDRRLGTLDDAPRDPRIAYVSPRRGPGPALLWGRVLGPRWTRRAGADLLHATFLAPPRPPNGVPLVATVHDLIPLHHPARFNRRQRWVFRRSLALAATASRVIAVSHETAARFRDAYGVDETRIDVIPPPVDVERYGAVLRRGLSGVDEPYLLHLGGFDPLKGVPDLLLPAFAHVVRERRELLLALTGSGAGRRDAERVARDLGLTGRVLFVGHLEAQEHVSAIAGASAVVVSSWEEGFGLPAAEALAAGVPLAVGPAAATREAAGRHAALAPAPTPEGLAEAIGAAIASGGRSSDEAESRRLFARRFAPERVAARVIDAYRAALSAAPARRAVARP